MTCRSALCMKPPRHSGSPSRQRKGDCFMHEPQYAGHTRNTCLQGRHDDETTVSSQSVSNSASTPSLDHAPRDPLFPVAHAPTRSFMKEQSSSCATKKSEWLTRIEAVLEMLNEGIVITNEDQRNSLCELSFWGDDWYPPTRPAGG